MSGKSPPNDLKGVVTNGLKLTVGGLVAAVIGFAVVYYNIQRTGSYYVILLIGAWLAVVVFVIGIGMVLVGLARQGVVGVIIATLLATCLLGTCALFLYLFSPLVSAFARLLPGALGVFLVAVLGALIASAIRRLGSAPSTPARPSTAARTPEAITHNQIAQYLQQAKALAESGELEQASETLEEALRVNPSWAPEIAGHPRETRLAQSEPVSGYALLVHIAGGTEQKDIALKYFRRMLELNPEMPGNARQAAREAGIAKEAKRIAKEMGFSWRWWEY